MNLFHTCLVNEFFPDVGFAVVKVLEHLGYTVTVPSDQTCCGQPAFNAGFPDAARIAARQTVEVLERTSGPIVVPSGSCGDMVIHQYAHLFADDDHWRERARSIAARTVEFSALVSAAIDRMRLRRVETTVAYHASCHLARGLGIDREPREVIAALPGVKTRPMVPADECCGFGGLFSIKHGDISSRILERKLGQVAATGAERLVSCDMGCLLHIAGGMHRERRAVKVQHLAELVAEAIE